ncbi:MAG: PEGA domain-containing protein [Archangium sp.]|nr:PEGA domain-containing protein [Archangium sp.]
MTSIVLMLALAAPPRIVTIESIPSGADVKLDGEDSGLTPKELTLEPGKHSIVVSMPGYPSVKQDVKDPKNKSVLKFDLVTAERKRLEERLKKAKADLKKADAAAAKSWTGETENALNLANEAVEEAKRDLAKFEASLK